LAKYKRRVSPSGLEISGKKNTQKILDFQG
jgi:hypothetical protein